MNGILTNAHNGFNASKSINNPDSVLGKFVRYVRNSERTGQDATRNGFAATMGKSTKDYAKETVRAAMTLDMIHLKSVGKNGTHVFELGPAAVGKFE